MNIVTKYAMLALFTSSFIALNNCGNQTGSTKDEAFGKEQSGEASDYAILGGPFFGYPNITGPFPFEPVETICGNGVDDDGDGLVDCMDSDCWVHPECSEWGPPLEEHINGRALTVYPNGILVPEDYVILKARGADDDDAHRWQRTNFFSVDPKDCWIDPRVQDPYASKIPLGEPFLLGWDGPIGPLLFPELAFYGWDWPFGTWGPRRGLIDECEFGTDIMFFNADDDDGSDDGDD
jgi:hypothetical protein